MRGARLAIAAVWISAASCAGFHPPPDPPPPSRPAAPSEARRPAEEPPRGAARTALDEGPVVRKGPAVAVPVPGEAPKRDPDFDELVRMQKEIVARRPESDDEKLRLALLYASGGEVEKAEQALAAVRGRSNKLVPYLEFFLRRQLGEHKQAARILADFEKEDRLVAGFVIERAELCSRVHRFRDVVPAEGDRVKPGGTVLLYVEPRNFTLNRNQDKYILHLRYEWSLYDDRSVEVNVPAWQGAPLSVREDRPVFSGAITEFYQSFILPLPANLAMGHYRVKVTVTDVNAGKSDRMYVPIYVTAVGPGQ